MKLERKVKLTHVGHYNPWGKNLDFVSSAIGGFKQGSDMV